MNYTYRTLIKKLVPNYHGLFVVREVHKHHDYTVEDANRNQKVTSSQPAPLLQVTCVPASDDYVAPQILETTHQL